MTEIEQKALALAIETRVDDRYRLCPDPTLTFGLWEALCRAIEQHEQFKREVSDAIIDCGAEPYLGRFILPKPVDPLVEVAEELRGTYCATGADWAKATRAALAKRGLEIREIEG